MKAAAQQTQAQKPEQKSDETKPVEPQVQSEIEKMEAQERGNLLKDAPAALEETRMRWLHWIGTTRARRWRPCRHASGKLDLVVARDPHLALAPVGVTTRRDELICSARYCEASNWRRRRTISRDRVQEADHIGEQPGERGRYARDREDCTSATPWRNQELWHN